MRNRLLIHAKLSQIRFYLLFFNLILDQTEFCLVPTQSEKDTYNLISTGLSKMKPASKNEVDFSVCILLYMWKMLILNF